MNETVEADRRGRRRARPREDRDSRRISPCRRAGSISACSDTILGQEARLYDYKRDAMLAFIRANKLNKIITSGGPNAKIGIITTGKSLSRRAPGARRTRHRRSEAATSSASACSRSAARGRSSRDELIDFAKGLDLIIVVEEKRSLIEVQVREELYGTANQPRLHRQEGRARRVAVPDQGRARPERDRDRDRRAAARART